MMTRPHLTQFSPSPSHHTHPLILSFSHPLILSPWQPFQLFNVVQFMMYDKDNSGKVTVDETMHMLYARYGKARLESQMKQLFGEDLKVRTRRVCARGGGKRGERGGREERGGGSTRRTLTRVELVVCERWVKRLGDKDPIRKCVCQQSVVMKKQE